LAKIEITLVTPLRLMGIRWVAANATLCMDACTEGPFHTFTWKVNSWLGRVIIAMQYTMEARIEMKYTLHNTPKLSQ